ncbi:UNVERIFIED_CONTAM: hypothetical protein K2H54_035243 [Gekko kuhli]
MAGLVLSVHLTSGKYPLVLGKRVFAFFLLATVVGVGGCHASQTEIPSIHTRAAFSGDIALDEEDLKFFQVDRVVDLTRHTIERTVTNSSAPSEKITQRRGFSNIRACAVAIDYTTASRLHRGHYRFDVSRRSQQTLDSAQAATEIFSANEGVTKKVGVNKAEEPDVSTPMGFDVECRRCRSSSTLSASLTC